jgi:hypothetical protein
MDRGEICRGCCKLFSCARQRSESSKIALAATIDAGILTSTNRTTTASEEIEATLLQLHLLSLPDLAPGESQLVTKGLSIALASSALACPWGNCEASYVQSPAVTSHATANASFVLPWSVVAEVTAGVGACALDEEETTEVGVQAVTWGCVGMNDAIDRMIWSVYLTRLLFLHHLFFRANPYAVESSSPSAAAAAAAAATSVGGAGISYAAVSANDSVVSLSLTACSVEIRVQNLTPPIGMTIPVSTTAQAGPLET